MPLPRVSNVFLQVVIVINFILTVWANQCTWLPTSYQFCNFLVLAVGVGAVVSPTDHAISELFLFGMAFALLQDIIIIATTYDGDRTGSDEIVLERQHKKIERGQHTDLNSGGHKLHFYHKMKLPRDRMSILNLLVKPPSLVLIVLNYIGRGNGGLKQKLSEYRASRATRTEPTNEVVPAQEPMPY